MGIGFGFVVACLLLAEAISSVAPGPPDRIARESLTQNVLMRDVAASSCLLAKFKAMGVQIVVDDFGTACSSLSYPNQSPIDVLKIDQSFVKAIDGKARTDGAIISAVIGIGKNLHQRVIAEGVERDGQLAFLKEQGCNEGQATYSAGPINAVQMQAMLKTGVRSR